LRQFYHVRKPGRGHAKQPNHSTYHFHLGIALSQKGDKTKALEQIKEALKYNPSKEEKQKIQELITRLG